MAYIKNLLIIFVSQLLALHPPTGYSKSSKSNLDSKVESVIQAYRKGEYSKKKAWSKLSSFTKFHKENKSNRF